MFMSAMASISSRCFNIWMRVLGALMLTVGCLSVATAVTAARAAPPARGAVPSHVTAAVPCSAAVSRAAFGAFVAAFNTGDLARLDALFADADDFQWFSSNAPGLRRTTAAKNRATLLRYFRSRHLMRDRLALVAFHYTATDSVGRGNFTFTLKRSASDFRKGARFGLIGKGATMCTDDVGEPARFVVISVGGADSDHG
jgi:hypothetical protein